MKINSIMKKTKSYLKELTVVTIGVLIALVISNIKENNQAKQFQIASIKTIKNEVEANYASLKDIMEKQTSLLDTIKKYSNDRISIADLISKANGLQISILSNTALEFYKKNQINLIDFEMMSMLIRMNLLSEIIDINIEKFRDYLYPNLFVDSEESKELSILYLRNLLESEAQIIYVYEKFIDEYIEATDIDVK